MLALIFASSLLNLLALNGPLFMLQVYDRVLASGSIQTLVALCVLAGVLYSFQAIMDALRARLLLRLGEGFDARFSSEVLSAIARAPLRTRLPGDGQQPMRDLDCVRAFLAGPGPGAFFDLPWVPFYLAVCFLLHFWLGVTALAGAVLMFAITLASDIAVRGPARTATQKGVERAALSESARRNAESIRAMGMEHSIHVRWQDSNDAYLNANRKSADFGSAMNGASRSLRQALQSAILAVGAWLVIQQEASAGVMIAASIMMGRAMAPVDTAISQWKHFVTARQGWQRLKTIVRDFGTQERVLKLPPPARSLQVSDIVVVPPGGQAPGLANISFLLEAGSALGVIGPSGCGKTTLARAIAGIWQTVRGEIRIDGATLDQWDPAYLGRHVGYLPQSAELFEGTIAQNIARFQHDASDASIVDAAKAARAHDFITALPQGYQTVIGIDGAGLSGGQKQRIGLARALYGDPFLLVLDEPNANLDAGGEAGLLEAIQHQKDRNGIAVVIAHRPSAMAAVDQILLLENGRAKSYGPKEQVLAQVLKKPVPAATSPGAQMINPLRVVANGSVQGDIQTAPMTEQGKENE
ncbi:type I secretion system permease/ATPase [Labrenzia aggregata]|uniref:Type I secretion system permease/ATPase n=1 Tax=Roseibium aggregatum TaxID=187304 RepID=A0A939J6F6_9HYPH|nr:type I secretion system permease/ATPase [Roseibium aggregatum]